MDDGNQLNPWVVGFVMFASILLIVNGLFQVYAGLVGIFKDSFFVSVDDYLVELDVTLWGWIKVLLGVGAIVVGYMIFAARPWAIAIGIIWAVISAVENFMFIPFYPIWSVLMLALDILVILALSIFLQARTPPPTRLAS